MEINPDWHDAYKQDLYRNLSSLSNGFNRQLFMKDLWQECIMYSCDMCLYYYKTGAFQGFLPTTIDDITYNVCAAMNSLLPQFNESQWKPVFDGVKELLEDPMTYDTLQENIDEYYHR